MQVWLLDKELLIRLRLEKRVFGHFPPSSFARAVSSSSIELSKSTSSSLLRLPSAKEEDFTKRSNPAPRLIIIITSWVNPHPGKHLPIKQRGDAAQLPQLKTGDRSFADVTPR